MSGGRHAAAVNQAGGALRSARFVLALLAIVLVPALLGLIIYWLVIATNLERLGTLSLVWLATFVIAIARRREDRAYPWVAGSLVLSTTWQCISELAHQRRWQAGHLHSIALIGNVIYVISAVCFGVAVLIWIRTSGRSLLRRLMIRIRP